MTGIRFFKKSEKGSAVPVRFLVFLQGDARRKLHAHLFILLRLQMGDSKAFPVATLSRRQRTMEIKDYKTAGIVKPKKTVAPNNGEVRVSQLTTSENLIVYSIRAWVDSLKSKRNPLLNIQKGFGCAGISNASIAFDELMLISATASNQALDVRYLYCKVLGDAELDFIALISFAQHGKSEWAYRRLGSWLAPAAARRSLAEVEKIAEAMEGVGLYIGLRNEFMNFDLDPVHVHVLKLPNVPSHKTVQ